MDVEQGENKSHRKRVIFRCASLNDGVTLGDFVVVRTS